MADFTPMQRGNSRVFLIEGGPGPTHTPVYMGCMAAGGVSQDFGDVTNIECPSAEQHNAYDIVGEIQGEIGRVETTLTGHYALNLESTLLRLAKKRCRVDVVIVSGACTSPKSYNVFAKAKHLENGRIPHHETDEEGSLKTADNAEVNESATVSAAEQYEVMPLAFGTEADAVVTTEVLDVVICDSPSCGDCTTESGGCQKIYAVQKDAAGSPGVGTDVIYSLDGGVSWNTSNVDSMTGSDMVVAIACLNGYVVVASINATAAGALHYVLQDDLTGLGGESWTRITTGFVEGPGDMWSTGTYLFIAGTGGYVYGTDDPTAGVTVLNNLAATTPTTGVVIVDDLVAIHAIDNTFAVAVGGNGAIMMTENQVTWVGLDPLLGGAGLTNTAVWCINRNMWWIGTSTGRLYYTVDGGVTFVEKAFSGSGTGRVDDIAFSNDAVGYMAHASATPKGRIFRTHSGGGGSGDNGGWYLMPDNGKGTLPASDRIDALAACRNDVNFVVGVGLADNATDGIILVGED